MEIDDIKLINLVRAHSELYDLNDPHYDVRPRRDAAWQHIGDVLQLSPRDCRDKWKRIRDCYRRALKLRRIKSERGAKIIKKVKYERALSFLEPHLKAEAERAAAAAAAERESSPDAPEPPSPPAASPPPAPPTTPATPAPHATPAAPAFDKLTGFFMGLVQTVQEFPEDVQIRVKRDIFRIVSDAEELVYKNSQSQYAVLGIIKEE